MPINIRVALLQESAFRLKAASPPSKQSARYNPGIESSNIISKR
jgi:hypothetical protein